jgi:hypothetical protein
LPHDGPLPRSERQGIHAKPKVTLTGNTVSAKFSNVDTGNSSFNAISLKAISDGRYGGRSRT